MLSETLNGWYPASRFICLNPPLILRTVFEGISHLPKLFLMQLLNSIKKHYLQRNFLRAGIPGIVLTFTPGHLAGDKCLLCLYVSVSPGLNQYPPCISGKSDNCRCDIKMSLNSEYTASLNFSTCLLTIRMVGCSSNVSDISVCGARGAPGQNWVFPGPVPYSISWSRTRDVHICL